MLNAFRHLPGSRKGIHIFVGDTQSKVLLFAEHLDIHSVVFVREDAWLERVGAKKRLAELFNSIKD